MPQVRPQGQDCPDKGKKGVVVVATNKEVAPTRISSAELVVRVATMLLIAGVTRTTLGSAPSGLKAMGGPDTTINQHQQTPTKRVAGC